MRSDTAHVLAWRRRLASLGVTQPFKQAHREIYVVTDAERATATYSNRFAGHIVEQHRFRALCQARGWSCPAFGAWDPDTGRPMKRLPDRDLQIELWVEPLETAMDEETYQFLYLVTAQVQFLTAKGEARALEQVDPVLFSELMRDCDLFVGVTSIGSTPDWTSDLDGQLGDYWSKAAFGALSEAGKTRRAVLEDLLPGLAIATAAVWMSATCWSRASSAPIASTWARPTSRCSRATATSASSRTAPHRARACGCRSKATTRWR